METNSKIFLNSFPVSGIRNINKKNLLNLISRAGTISRSQLANISGLTPPSVSKITRVMIQEGILVEQGTIDSTGKAGRKEINLSVNPESAYVIGISLTANRPKIVLSNAVGETLDTKDLSDLKFSEIDKTIGQIISRVKDIVFDNSIDKKKLLGIGVSAALSLGSTEDVLFSLPLGWKGVSLRDRLEKELNLPVKIEARASALLKAEISQLEIPKDIYLINVALNTGVSAFIGGGIFNPMLNGFGSISHLILDENGPKCLDCGRKGCFETLASGISLVKFAETLKMKKESKDRQLHKLISQADRGNMKIKKLFFNAGKYLGQAIDSIKILFNPSMLIVAGEVGRQNDYAEGVNFKLNELGYKNIENFLRFSQITSEEAAKSVALDEFIFAKSFDVDQLKIASDR